MKHGAREERAPGVSKWGGRVVAGGAVRNIQGTGIAGAPLTIFCGGSGTKRIVWTRAYKRLMISGAPAHGKKGRQGAQGSKSCFRGACALHSGQISVYTNLAAAAGGGGALRRRVIQFFKGRGDGYQTRSSI